MKKPMTGMYGPEWEQYRPRAGDVWAIKEHRFLCGDVFTHSQQWLEMSPDIDVMYVDPPWNEAVTAKFYQYANGDERRPFLELIDKLAVFAKHVKGLCVIEMGLPNQAVLLDAIDRYGLLTDAIGTVTYGSKSKPTTSSYWIGHARSGTCPQDTSWFTLPPDLHGKRFSQYICTHLCTNPGTVFADPMAGEGFFPLYAALAGATVAAAELIPRKFAKMLKQFHRFGTPTKLHSSECECSPPQAAGLSPARSCNCCLR